MNRIKLSKLKLRFFKGEVKRDIDFGDKTIIKGSNESGKSTIADAWTFLIYGRDSLGKTNFDIKTQKTERVIKKLGWDKEQISPLDFIEDVEHSVYGEIYVNDTLVKLKRTIVQEWGKTPEGNRIFKGHKTKCEYDELDVSVTEYQRRIGEIIDDNLFKLMTDINYFHQLNKEERRNLLISLDNSVTNESIAEQYPQFLETVKSLGNMDIADKRKILNKQKARLKKQQDEIPTRIDELMNSTPTEIDFEKIEGLIKVRRDELKTIQTSFDDIEEKFKKEIALSNELTKKKVEIGRDRNDRMVALEIEETNRVSKLNEKYHSYTLDVEALDSKISRYNILLKEVNSDINRNLSTIKTLEEEKEALSEKWIAEKNKKYIPNEGVIRCPLYNHICEDETANFEFVKGNDNSKAIFIENIKKAVKDIESEGIKVASKIKEFEKITEEFRERASIIKKKIDKHQLELEDLQQNPPTKETRKIIDLQSDAEWVRLDKEYKALEIPAPTLDDSDLTARRFQLNKEIEELNKELHNRDVINRNQTRIKALNDEQRQVANELADIESKLNDLLEFSKTKTREVDEKINSKFQYVTFRLFEHTLGDNIEKETCETLINGVEYETANNASRINAGIDIINAFAKHHNFYAPIFIDNAESVNTEKLLSSHSQQVLLYVTDDKELQIIN